MSYFGMPANLPHGKRRKMTENAVCKVCAMPAGSSEGIRLLHKAPNQKHISEAVVKLGGIR